MRNKGKVHPSSDSLSILNLLPSTILTLTIVLSLEDQHVLAYMITLNTKKTLKTHNSPLFECDCFECYTSYWFKWDSSPNRELIHQAIEAYEESLTSSGQHSKKKTKKKGHRSFAGKNDFPLNDQKGLQDFEKGQMGQSQFAEKGSIPVPEVTCVQENGHRSFAGKDVFPALEEKGIQDFQKGQMGQCQFAGKMCSPVPEVKGIQEIGHRSFAGKDVFPALEEKGLQDLPKGQMGQCQFAGKRFTAEEVVVVGVLPEVSPEISPEMRAPAMSQHNKGLARKVLPDVIGLFNWRLWSLWSPNM